MAALVEVAGIQEIARSNGAGGLHAQNVSFLGDKRREVAIEPAFFGRDAGFADYVATRKAGFADQNLLAAGDAGLDHNALHNFVGLK